MSDETFSHYRIIRKLGAGGMGEVFLAEDQNLRRQVALKLLPADFTGSEERLRRFELEARAVSALNHPNILTIHEVGETDGHHFIATEFIDGESLAQYLSRKQGIQPDEILTIAVQIASALVAAHEEGIVHRDIKPANIMLRRDGYVKVVDFGLAKLTQTETLASGAPTSPMVRSEAGAIMGTVRYMSPEQARGLPVDARTDIWSLGCVLYEMVSGRAPFHGGTVTDVLVAILEKEPAQLRHSARSRVPETLEWIITKMLRKRPDERYQTSKELLVDLQRIKQQIEIEAHLERSSPPESSGDPADVKRHPAADANDGGRRIPVRVAAGYAALVLTLIAMAYLWQRNAVPDSQTEIVSLAVLPLRSLDASENFLGLGIADAVIRRINQTGKLIVRPTSAIRRYVNDDTDALTAARELEADAVLEGTVQRADQRLRVSVNLLRTSDGRSLWSDSFDLQGSDIFTIQDTVAQQVASHLRLKLDASQQASLTKPSTSNPIAYEFYLKGVYSFDQRGWGNNAELQMNATIDLFRRAIEADPSFALAHAQLAYAYAWKALFITPTEPVWAALAKEQIAKAQALDPHLAETRLARQRLLWSVHEGWQTEAAIREILAAQQLNPNIGHIELAPLYDHLGLEEQALRASERALEIDPTSEYVKTQIVNSYWGRNKYDDWMTVHQKYFPGEPVWTWYLMGKGRLDEAQKTIEDSARKDPDNALLPWHRAMLFALRGDFRNAEAEIPSALSRRSRNDPSYHHLTYDIACIYALAGKSDEAVKWLRETAATGFPCYPLFASDPRLDRIRTAPEFVRFLAEMSAQYDRYKSEFG